MLGVAEVEQILTLFAAEIKLMLTHGDPRSSFTMQELWRINSSLLCTLHVEPISNPAHFISIHLDDNVTSFFEPGLNLKTYIYWMGITSQHPVICALGTLPSPTSGPFEVSMSAAARPKRWGVYP
jgi:hypothetical protein